MQPVSKQWISKHALLEKVFTIRSVQSGYKEVVGWWSSSVEWSYVKQLVGEWESSVDRAVHLEVSLWIED
jgi:hypothetical protein